VKAHAERGETPNEIFQVNFWAACDTYMKIREAKLDKLYYKLKNLFTRRRNPKGVGGFIQRIDNKIYRTLI
jgi:hypothetical protein